MSVYAAGVVFERCSSFAAHSRYPQPTVLIDSSTATIEFVARGHNRAGRGVRLVINAIRADCPQAVVSTDARLVTLEPMSRSWVTMVRYQSVIDTV